MAYRTYHPLRQSQVHDFGKKRRQILTMGDETAPDRWNLELAVQPSAQLSPNTVSTLPLVLAVKFPVDELNSVGDMSSIWALVSLLNGEGSRTLVPPRAGLLTGRTIASIQTPSLQADSNGHVIGYACFTDLAITTAGQYRLRVSLIDMDCSGPSHRPGPSGRNVQSVSTNKITVDPGVVSQRPTTGDVEMVSRLRRSGILKH